MQTKRKPNQYTVSLKSILSTPFLVIKINRGALQLCPQGKALDKSGRPYGSRWNTDHLYLKYSCPQCSRRINLPYAQKQLGRESDEIKNFILKISEENDRTC